MSEISPTEAIKLTGKARQTVYDAMDKGDLSFNQIGPRKRLIDIAELERWNRGLKKPGDEKTSDHVSSRQEQTSASSGELALLKQQLDILGSERKREREQYEEQIYRLESALKASQEQQTRLTALLTDQSKNKESRAGEQDKRFETLEKANEELKKQNRRVLYELKAQKDLSLWERVFGKKDKASTHRKAG